LPDDIKEGWGITHVDNYKGLGSTKFIVSDGSSNLYVVNPEDFTVEETIKVINKNNGSESPSYLNELEYINGTIWAN